MVRSSDHHAGAAGPTRDGPLFLALDGRALFAFHHAPAGARGAAGAAGAAGAVILSHPFGHEYVRSHRALRQLALKIAAGGRAVLRFDYSGCGDSTGDLGGARLDTWLEDLGHAGREARRLAGGELDAIVGLGLGASLAVLAPAGASRLALWDPVVRGRDHLAAIARRHEELARASTARWPDDGASEALGFPLPVPLADDIARIDLTTMDARPADDVLIIETDPRPRCHDLADRLRALGARVATRHHPTPELLGDDPFRPRVPADVLASAVEWIGGGS